MRRPRAADPAPAFELTELLLDLAAAGREDDFRWLARSQGVPGEMVERLWRNLSTASARRAAR